MRLMSRRAALLVAAVVAVTACGGSPLESIGLRSSDWINEPTVVTTTEVVATTPTVVSADQLLWANDDIQQPNLDDRDAMLAEVFSRREGDRFIQASRLEIAAALPDIMFPAEAPNGAGWVSSQLVFDNDGTIADDPSAAFGFWSAEPYTRSRSVAQLVVLRVATDEEAANELASGAAEASCARFSDRNADECEILPVADRETWFLENSGSTTLIWYQGPHRYEMFGRSFVPVPILENMAGQMVRLSSLGQDPS